MQGYCHCDTGFYGGDCSVSAALLSTNAPTSQVIAPEDMQYFYYPIPSKVNFKTELTPPGDPSSISISFSKDQGSVQLCLFIQRDDSYDMTECYSMSSGSFGLSIALSSSYLKNYAGDNLLVQAKSYDTLYSTITAQIVESKFCNDLSVNEY